MDGLKATVRPESPFALSLSKGEWPDKSGSYKSRTYSFHALRKDHNVSLLTDSKGKIFVRSHGKILAARLEFLGATAAALVLGQRRYFFTMEKLPEGLRLVRWGDLCIIKNQATEAPRLFAELFGQPTIVLKSQMPGLVAALHAKANRYVKEGETLLVIEAMKMQNPIKSPCSGKVERLFVSAGMSVEGGVPLLELRGHTP